jgi:hypothetical protein
MAGFGGRAAPPPPGPLPQGEGEVEIDCPLVLLQGDRETDW